MIDEEETKVLKCWTQTMQSGHPKNFIELKIIIVIVADMFGYCSRQLQG